MVPNLLVRQAVCDSYVENIQEQIWISAEVSVLAFSAYYRILQNDLNNCLWQILLCLFQSGPDVDFVLDTQCVFYATTLVLRNDMGGDQQSW